MFARTDRLRSLLSRRPLTGLRGLAQAQRPRIFMLDLCALALRLPNVDLISRARRSGYRFLTILPPEVDDTQMLRLLFSGMSGFALLTHPFQKDLRKAIIEMLDNMLWVPRRILCQYVELTD